MATPTNLPASFVTGNVLTAAQMNDLRGAFRILQIVNANTTTPVANATNTYAATGLSASITPQSTSSQILVVVNQNGADKSNAAAGNSVNVRLMRGATQISLITFSAGYTGVANNIRTATISTMFLDSPNTTSAVTYSTQFMNPNNAAAVTLQIGNDMSTITLLEISA
jgi:hypothetical protein